LIAVGEGFLELDKILMFKDVIYDMYVLSHSTSRVSLIALVNVGVF
jgi:hypothetical protein